MIHYHGTPITPRSALMELTGRHFCVSFAAPNDVAVCHQIGQSVMLDNGAFSRWRSQKPTDWPGFVAWARVWLEFPTTWAVMPDVIDGNEADQEALSVWLYAYDREVWSRCAPVWHMHESLDRLRHLCASHERVCIGSSGQFSTVGTAGWHRRMEAAFNAIGDGWLPWVHMLRGMSLSGSQYPFASVDSTDIAQNHNRPQNTPRRMADRWDAIQCPARWDFREQLEIAL